MQLDLDGIAAVVDVTVENAVAPLLARLALAEQGHKDLQVRLTEIVELRDRVVVVETKTTMASPVQPIAVDLSPLSERVASAEQRHDDLQARVLELLDIRDRVVVMETKSAMASPSPTATPPIDLSPVMERIAAVEQRQGDLQTRVTDLSDVRDRVLTIEAKSTLASPLEPVLQQVSARVGALEARPVADIATGLVDRIEVLETTPEKTVDLSPVLDRLLKVEIQLQSKVAETPALQASLTELSKDLGALRERVAVAEVRPLLPGPPGTGGKDGQPGTAGLNGTNGADGLGWDDLGVVQVDERTFTVKCTRGLQVKELATLTFPVQIYRGVYVDGRMYDRGDGVTWGGSEWHCNETTTTKPGDGSKAWTLKVKRGRDGKDGKDAMPVPVVSIAK